VVAIGAFDFGPFFLDCLVRDDVGMALRVRGFVLEGTLGGAVSVLMEILLGVGCDVDT